LRKLQVQVQACHHHDHHPPSAHLEGPLALVALGHRHGRHLGQPAKGEIIIIIIIIFFFFFFFIIIVIIVITVIVIM
jgi:hypothetical protein